MSQQNFLAYTAGAAVAAVVVFTAMHIGTSAEDVPTMQTQRNIISNAEQLIVDSPDRRKPNRAIAEETRVRVVPTPVEDRPRW